MILTNHATPQDLFDSISEEEAAEQKLMGQAVGEFGAKGEFLTITQLALLCWIVSAGLV